MMTGRLTCCDGAVLELPELLEWRLDYTAGVPCDSFSITFPWGAGAEEQLDRAVEFSAATELGTVFRGVVDEYECRADGGGRRVVLTGRGMAALLLDNEAQAADYLTATETDILRDHVLPYGIEVADHPALPAVSGFTAASGSSEWQVLYDFARYYGGVAPRFDRAGRLVLSPWEDRTALVVDAAVPVTGLRYCRRRYGVLSEVLVRDRTRFALERVENRPFLDQGGRRRQVMTMPGRSNYLAMRYSGQFQIDRSAAQRTQIELTVPELFFAWPGDLVNLERGEFGLTGAFRVREAAVVCNGDGGETKLTLGDRDAVL